MSNNKLGWPESDQLEKMGIMCVNDFLGEMIVELVEIYHLLVNKHGLNFNMKTT